MAIETPCLAARSEVLVARTGCVDYLRAWRWQRELVGRVSRGELPSVLLLLEHPHVYTIGRGGTREHLLADEATLAAIGAEAHDVDRGGDITYHGPGQLVGYPLLRVERFGRDVHRYLRLVEGALIGALGELGIEAGREPGYTGVWVGDEKVAAIGVKIAQHVTLHGFAINVAPEMTYWRHIVPCGIHDRGVTSIERLLGRSVPLAEVADLVVRHFAREFGLAPVEIAVADGPETAADSGLSLIVPPSDSSVCC